MAYDINTIDELIDLLGGPSLLGSDLGIGSSAVCNWAARGFIPPSWHFRLYLELRKRSKTANPELFETEAENLPLMFPERAGMTVAA